MRRKWLLFVAAAALMVTSDARACTSFCFEQDGTRVFGKNYDWNVDDGLVVVNKRGVAKRAFVESAPLRWTSRYECFWNERLHRLEAFFEQKGQVK